MSTLYYGDNLEVLRKYGKDETVDLCYIDPPFNSKKNYNQIYNNIGSEDRAQAQAFVDTWVWDDLAIDGFHEILENRGGRFRPQTIELIKGLHKVLGEGSLLAYLISMTLRIVEIHRMLKLTGSFYLHCDPTSSHYLKLVLDGIFCSQGGDFLNEIVWCFDTGGKGKKNFHRKHNTIFRYGKSGAVAFYYDQVALPRDFSTMHETVQVDENGRRYQRNIKAGKEYRYYEDVGVLPNDWWADIQLNPAAKERLGYPTQKPEMLLERIINASTKKGDVILDAYCGCGTTVAVAQRLERQWVGIDITYQAIAVILKRLADTFTPDVAKSVVLSGIPKDMDSAVALAKKSDDRVRKEFEKWAVLTYSNNRATINDKKGADKGIDGVVHFMTGVDTNEKMIFQVKSGNVGRKDIAQLRGDMESAGAVMATLITLQEPTKPMIDGARDAGNYYHEAMGRNYDKIQIVTVQELIRQRRLDLPLSHDALKSASRLNKKPTELVLPGLDLPVLAVERAASATSNAIDMLEHLKKDMNVKKKPRKAKAPAINKKAEEK